MPIEAGVVPAQRGRNGLQPARRCHVLGIPARLIINPATVLRHHRRINRGGFTLAHSSRSSGQDKRDKRDQHGGTFAAKIAIM
jgi:hypothetical protein